MRPHIGVPAPVILQAAGAAVLLDLALALGHQTFCHHVAEGRLVRCDALGYCLQHKIAVGHDTNRAVVVGCIVGDDQRADVMLPHQFDCLLQSAIMSPRS